MFRLPKPFSNPMTYKGHSGVDYPQPEGTPFLASDDGVVEWLGHNSRGGFFMWVRYASIGPRVGYHHMPSHALALPVGSRFGVADRLGVVGNTGNSTGPHLHSEVEGFATTDGYWKFFNPSDTVSPNTASDNLFTKESEEMVMEYINIQGKANERRGGCYAIMRSNKGALFARFVSSTPLNSAPTITDDRALKDWDATFGSMPGLK